MVRCNLQVRAGIFFIVIFLPRPKKVLGTTFRGSLFSNLGYRFGTPHCWRTRPSFPTPPHQWASKMRTTSSLERSGLTPKALALFRGCAEKRKKKKTRQSNWLFILIIRTKDPRKNFSLYCFSRARDMMAKVHSDVVQSDGGGILESMVEDKSGSNLDVIGRNLILGLIFFFFPRHYFR